MNDSSDDFLLILRTLAAHKVDFIVVGGASAVLQGAPIVTYDLDVVHSRAPANLQRLLAALNELGTHYRGREPQRTVPSASLLASPGHHLLMTRAGALDVLGTIGTDSGYDDLLAHTEIVDVGRGLKVRVLHLKTLIELKEQLARDKDQAALCVLRRTLEERSRQ